MAELQQVEYMRSEPAAKLAGMTRQWLTRLVKAGEVPGAATIAGYHVFDRKEFAPWAEEQQRKRKRPLTEK